MLRDVSKLVVAVGANEILEAAAKADVDAVAGERAAVVAWLRSDERKDPPRLDDLADAIERGDHRNTV